MILELKDACFRYGDITIFNNVNIEVNECETIGLVGANGQGKSTLLGVISGEKELFSGTLYKKSGLTIGYLHQNADFVSSNTLYEELSSVFNYEHELLEKINNVASEMASVDSSSTDYNTLAEKYHRLCLEADARDAYNTEVKVKTVLNGMGMANYSQQVVSTLSGGEKTKAALCKLLLERPELMILDEPTNHLDYKTLDWLEDFLSDKKSTLIIVSHDRYFLDRLCTRIWEVQHKVVTSYFGNYTKYKTLKAERTLVQQREHDKQQKEIEKLTDYVDRNKVRASTANMAKSREKMLDRMEIVDAPDKDDLPPRFCFCYSSEPSEFPLTISKLTLGYGERVLLDNVSLQIKRGSKTALLGLNGTGKSTLLKRINAENPLDLGKIIFGKNVRKGYYDQENALLHNDLRVMDELWFDNMKMTQTEVRSLLAQVTLGADDALKTVGSLSGGEKAKLGLAMIMAKDCNLLLLDEPTNHLDLPSREALEEALKNYTGTILFVSHDRYFVNAVASNIVELDNKQLVANSGNYDDFMARKKGAETKNEQVINSATKTENKGNYRSQKERAEQTNKAKLIKEKEKRITELEAEINELNNELSLPEVAGDFANLSKVLDALKTANEELEKTMQEWEELNT